MIFTIEMISKISAIPSPLISPFNSDGISFRRDWIIIAISEEEDPIGAPTNTKLWSNIIALLKAPSSPSQRSWN